MKEIDDRIQECINIRKQLESMGILTLFTVRELLTKHMNIFITEGESQHFKLKIPNSKMIFDISLTTIENKKSGITLLK